MEKQPLVSIIIPVYNGSNYIKEAIDSAINQTYSNIEIIVVNDGSNDNGATAKIVKKYGNKVKYFEKANGGVSTALNFAISKMTGEYFSWLSHDDRYYKNKIQSQIDYLKNYNDKTILYSDYDLMDENSNIFAVSKKNHEELIQKPEYSLLRGSIDGITLLIPKTAFDECGLFNEKLRCTQDYEMWRRMMSKYKFIHQPEVLATTRLHKNQTTNTSPVMLSEGNELWISLIESFSDTKKKELEFSVYNYYLEMLKFMKTTPYDGTIDFLNNKINEMELNCKKNLNKIKISVIIPFYKRNDLVINAVKSVLNQTHKSFEIILINDGTKNINKINDFLLKYKNIKLINSPKNCGPANARNIGIRKATGKYIAFLDSDDLFLPEKLEKQIIHMELNNSDFSYTSYFRKTNELEKIIDCYCEFSEIEKHSINNCNIATPTVMIRRSVINKYSLFYDEKKEIGEDVCFYLKIFKIIKPTMLNEPLSIVNSNTNSAYLDINKQIKGIKTIINYLTEDDYYDKYQKEIADLCLNYYNLVNSEQNENTNISKNNISIKKNYLKILVKRGPIYCAKKIKNKIKR